MNGFLSLASNKVLNCTHAVLACFHGLVFSPLVGMTCKTLDGS
jgi:hypothetical protein